MFCPSGHTIDAVGKKLRLFAYGYTCTRCGGKVSENGGFYHKCAARCEFRICKRCYDRALAKHYVLEPCTEAFPQGLGPFSLHRSSLKGTDLRPFDVARGRQVDPFSGGAWALSGSFFSRSRALSSVWSALIGSGLTMDSHPGIFQATGSSRRAADPDRDRCISVLVSPAAPVNVPELTRRMMSIPEGPGIMVAWVSPLQLEWQALAPDLDEASIGGTEWSLLTVGGFVYMRLASPAGGGVEVLCANSIAYSPRGIVNFSAAQPWRQAWTNHLLAAGRFQKVTAQRWANAGAKYMCWVAPEEKLVEPHGLHGGFAFLFHELDEADTENKDRFFEIVTTLGIRTFGAYETTMGGSSLMPPMLQRSAFAFSLAGDPASATQAHLERTRARFLRAAGEGRWALVGHMLGEWPYLATEADDREQTALHKCAALSGHGPGAGGGRLMHQLLKMLHDGGASIEARDSEGRTPYDLGDHCFKALVCQIWGLIPDIFADPELWFEYWDKDHDGVLIASELIPALAAAYQVGDLGRQWIETYVHTHHRELAPGSQLTRESFLGDKGLLNVLQSSEEFISLREKEDSTSQLPAIFRTEGRQRPTSFDKTILAGFEQRLEAIRTHYGWVLGKPPPPGARPLEVRAPFAGGESDPYARLVAAREMLAWSFTKTTALPGSTWLSGFKVAFKGGGDAGIDEGGLTKAWCSEIAYALFADETYFDSKSTGCFFKPDSETDLLLHCFHVKSDSFYRWVGRFMAYATYHGCMIDCRLCPWALRWLVRVTQSRSQTPGMLLNLAGDWRRLQGGGADGAGAEGAPAVATISGQTLMRYDDDTDESTTLAPELALSFEDGRLHADIDGQRQSAEVRDGKLFWSNGEVWVRSADSSPLAANATMPFWPETPEGNDQLLEDLATMDAAFANSLWRVAHEMPDEDLQWLTFSYAGLELVAGGEDQQVDVSNKGQYVRLCCKAVLLQRARRGLQAFAEGFFDVFPQELVTGMPADSFMWLLCGDDEISAEQIDLLERLVLSDGLVPQHLSENAAVIESARWVFNCARSSDGRFRSRLLEFWTGTPRLPSGGACAIAPRPRLQVMVQAAKPAAPPVWEICLQDGWYSYDLDTASSLESAHRSSAGQNTGSVTIAVRNNKYIVDLAAMVQVNQRTGARREIRRREQPADDAVRDGVRRIDTWPQGRLPEGHTCGNELWVPLCDSEEELARSLQLAVMNFEAGFALA